jgi:hypothetical protein
VRILLNLSVIVLNNDRELSSSTLAALQEFYNDKNSQAKLLNDSAAKEDGAPNEGPLSMSVFAEDWNQSQFWYSEATARSLAEALLASSPSHVAVVSAPSTFAALKYHLHHAEAGAHKPELTLLEYDDRFNVWPEFVHYDYNNPMKLPPNLKGKFDAIIVDPPFLSDECQTKAALTVRWLARTWSSDLRLLACTGERMGELVQRLYGKIGVKETDFTVVHGSGLSNEFRCYANFEWDQWKLKD